MPGPSLSAMDSASAVLEARKGGLGSPEKVLFIITDETSMKLNRGRGKGLLMSRKSLSPGKTFKRPAGT